VRAPAHRWDVRATWFERPPPADGDWVRVDVRDEGALEDALFRYVGPRPQFREAALVMLADTVEAASRAMPDPSRERLQALVQRIITAVFTEGQLDECDLTLRDLNAISLSFLNTLEGIYHSRPVYPPGALGGVRPAALALAPEGRVQQR